MMIFQDGTNTNWVTYDQNGQLMNYDSTENTWLYRRVDLSAYAGKDLQSINLMQQAGATGGPWDMYFQDVVLVSADGTVRPLYNRETSISLNPWVTSGVSNWGYAIDYHTVNDPTSPDDTTNYYQADAVGSERMMTSVDGYPVWQAMYAPFGDEVSPQMTMNDYKFAGLTRDLVTGLDQAMLRTYSSSINRWLTPDPARLSAVDPSNPQSWNAYAFTFDRPTTLTDPNGLTPCPAVYSSEMAWQGNGPAGPSGSGECDGTSNDPTGPGPVTIDANGDPLSPDIAEGEARYVSIITTGWDPVLGINWNDHPIQDPGCGSKVTNSVNTNIASAVSTNGALSFSQQGAGTPQGSNWDYTEVSNAVSSDEANEIADYINSAPGIGPGMRAGGFSPSIHAHQARVQQVTASTYQVVIDNAHNDTFNANDGVGGFVLHGTWDVFVGSIAQTIFGTTFGCH